MVELIKNYGKWYDLNYEIVYFYNVYGSGINSQSPNISAI